MKRFFLVVTMLGGLSVMTAGQDPLTVKPQFYTKLFENERLRVLEMKFPPGEKMPTHSHPDHAIYVADPGKVTITGSDGKANEADLKAGEVLWFPAQTHQGVNTGTTTVRLLVIELKEKP